MKRRGDGRRGDEGFTLVELLITLVIGPIILGAIVLMLLAIFRTQDSVSNRISGSVDAQVTTTNLQADVQNSTNVTTSSTPACGTTGTQIFGSEAEGNSIVISYDLVASGSKYQLVRNQCAATNTSTPTNTTVLAGSVPSNQTVSVTCASTCTTSSGWTPASVVSAVTLSVSEPSTGVNFTLTSTPRAWAPPTNQAGGSPIADITVLGSSTATNDCSSSALTLDQNSGIQYGNGGNYVQWGSSCTSTSASSSSSWNGDTDSWQSTTSTTSGSSGSSDPLSSLTAPTYSNPSGSGSCSGGSCSSGTYSSSQTFSGNTTFGSGTYVFTQPVTISGGTVTFGSGTYVFEGGLTICNNGSGSGSNVNLGSGTFIVSGSSNSSNAINVTGNSSVTCGSGGCLIYCNKGCCNFNTSGSVTLCGKSSNDGVCVWDSCSNGTSPCVSLCGGTSSSTSQSGGTGSCCNYGGVYCPSGSCCCNSGKCCSSFVDCGSLCVHSGSTLCVG